MQMVPLIMMGAGTIMSAYGRYQQGKALRNLGNYKADQLEAKADQERAVGQHKAEKRRRQAKLARSRALALSAASGGASDPTSMGIMAGITQEGELNAQYEIYKGEENARTAETGANVARYEGEQAYQAGKIGVFSTILQGAGMGLGQYNTMMGKYAPAPAPDPWAAGDAFMPGILR